MTCISFAAAQRAANDVFFGSFAAAQGAANDTISFAAAPLFHVQRLRALQMTFISFAAALFHLQRLRALQMTFISFAAAHGAAMTFISFAAAPGAANDLYVICSGSERCK